MACSEQKKLTPEERLQKARQEATRTAQRAAAIILGQMKGAAATAVPALQKAAQHPRWRVRMHAVQALGRIRRHRRKTIPVLLKALQDSQLLVQESARFALAQMGAAALPGLKTLAGSPTPSLRILVARTLAEMVKKEPAAVPILVAFLKDESPDVRVAAGKAMSQAKGRSLLPFLPQLLEALEHPRADVGYAVADALEQTGTAAEKQLLAGLQKKSRIRRRFCAIVLGNVGQHPGKVVPVLNNALQRASRELQVFRSRKQSQAYNEATSLVEALAEALGAYGAKAASGVRGLQALVAHPSVQVRRSVIKALGDIGKAAASAVPALKERVLKDRELEVRQEAIEALGKMGPVAAGAVPALIHTLRTDARLRTPVRAALAQIGTAAIPALLKILQSKAGP